MRPSFHPMIINGPLDDPGLLISFLFEKRALLLDLGDLGPLSARQILKISHVFVSHTHMDHFIGFDRLLRLFQGREKTLYMYGPEGFLKNIEGRLSGYTWNLVGNFTHKFVLSATEVRGDQLVTREYPCSDRFQPAGEKIRPFDGTLLEEPSLSVSAVVLDHGIPCLGFALKERFHVNIKKARMVELGLEVGPWLKHFKQALYDEQEPDSLFEIQTEAGMKKYELDDLAKRIALITPGQKIAYVTDVLGSDENIKKIVGLARNANHLFIEAAFLDEDGELAEAKRHLTAGQAGFIARKAGAGQFSIFHFSPRYTGMEHLLREEAEKSFTNSV